MISIPVFLLLIDILKGGDFFGSFIACWVAIHHAFGIFSWSCISFYSADYVHPIGEARNHCT